MRGVAEKRSGGFHMRIIDITRTLQEAPCYSGDPQPVVERVSSIAEGDAATISRITANVHAGTHADAPMHFFLSGASIDELPLENYCGPCRVITVPQDEMVKLSDIRGKFGGVERIALRGGSAVLCEEAADYIAACGVKALVTEAVSVGPEDNEIVIHQTLLGAGVAVIENADLSGAEDGDYLLFAFPAKYGGCDGAPVRAVLLKDEKPEIHDVFEDVPETEEEPAIEPGQEETGAGVDAAADI